MADNSMQLMMQHPLESIEIAILDLKLPDVELLLEWMMQVVKKLRELDSVRPSGAKTQSSASSLQAAGKKMLSSDPSNPLEAIEAAVLDLKLPDTELLLEWLVQVVTKLRELELLRPSSIAKGFGHGMFTQPPQPLGPDVSAAAPPQAKEAPKPSYNAPPAERPNTSADVLQQRAAITATRTTQYASTPYSAPTSLALYARPSNFAATGPTISVTTLPGAPLVGGAPQGWSLQ